jgi:septum formation protein
VPSRIILASASPRRAALLRQIGLTFEVQPVADEAHPEAGALEVAAGIPLLQAAERRARSLAESKAAMVATSHPEAIVIGADTIVVTDEGILGKPADAGDAARMLRLLSGRRHHVTSAVAVIVPSMRLPFVDSAVTAVWFRALSETEIAAYVATGEPLDKAGAYGIQGRAAVFVQRLEGDYFTVVGLPLSRLAALLTRAGVAVL